MSGSALLQDLVNALALGSSYALLALGLAIVFNILRLINFAHGELLTLSGFSMYVSLTHGLPWALVIPIALIVPMVAAVLMERIAFRPVRGATMTTTLVTSFALAVVVQMAVTIAFGARPKAVAFPEWVKGNVHLGPLDVQTLQLLTLGTTVVALSVLVVFFRRTLIGISMRAAAEDFPVTRLMGVRANRVVATAFAISGCLAGLAAIFYVARRGAVDPLMGLTPVLKAFIAAVIGGLGSLSGAVVGGFLLGVIEATLQAVLPDRSLPFADAIAFGIVVVVLLWRPDGILRRAARAT
jgi:branched-chain amino acid transport system permease protein